jgi:hypothetical protein
MLLGFSFAFGLAFLKAQVTIAPDHATGPSVSVNVTHAVKTLLPNAKTGLSIRYDFEFAKLRSVRIRGLGDVPAHGSYSYITTESSLLFSDPSTNVPIADVPLKETVTAASEAPLTEIPSTFPDHARFFEWDSGQPLPPRADAVLNRHFRYKPYDQYGVHFIATNFATFPMVDAPHGTLGLVAVQFSFPYNATTASYTLRVQSIVREGREFSSATKDADSLGPAESARLLGAADRFVDQIVAEMRSGPKKP